MQRKKLVRYIFGSVFFLLLRGVVGYMVDPFIVEQAQCVMSGICSEHDGVRINKYMSFFTSPQYNTPSEKSEDQEKFHNILLGIPQKMGGEKDDEPLQEIEEGAVFDVDIQQPKPSLGGSSQVNELGDSIDIPTSSATSGSSLVTTGEVVTGGGSTEPTEEIILTGPHRCPHPFGGYPLSHGDALTAYASAEVAYPDDCISEMRRCQYGTLGGTYTYSSCKQLGQSCVGPDGTVFPHDALGTYYQYDRIIGVPENGEDVCPREVRKCIDGMRNNPEQGVQPFAFTYRVCEVVAPQ